MGRTPKISLDMYEKWHMEKSFVMCVQAVLASVKAKRQNEMQHVLTKALYCRSEESSVSLE